MKERKRIGSFVQVGYAFSQAQMTHAPSKPIGWYEYQIRDCYRELCKSHGIGGARELLNEIADTTEERMK